MCKSVVRDDLQADEPGSPVSVINYLPSPSGRDAALLVPASWPLFEVSLRPASVLPAKFSKRQAEEKEARHTEMWWGVFLCEGEDLIHCGFPNIDQHVCVGEPLHGADLVPLLG